MNINMNTIFTLLDKVSPLFIVPETIGIGEREYNIDYTKGVILVSRLEEEGLVSRKENGSIGQCLIL